MRFEKIYQYPVLKDFAAYISRESANATTPLLSVNNRNGISFPIVTVCSLGADLEVWEQSGSDHPIIAFEYTGVDEMGLAVSWNSVEEIAANLNRILLKEHPSESFRFAAYCRGTVIAFEMARQLIAAGKKVEKIVFNEPSKLMGKAAIETTGEDGGTGRLNLFQLAKKHSQHALKLSGKDRVRYLKSKLMLKDRVLRGLTKAEVVLRAKCRLKIPSRLSYYYVINHVYRPVLSKYTVPSIGQDIYIFYNEFGGYYQGHKWSHLSTGKVYVRKLVGAGHGDSLGPPLLDLWISEVLS